jgi:hypothetical protein
MRRHSVSTSDSGGHLIQSKCGRTGGRQITLTKQMEWYELRGYPADAALPPLQAASEEAALGTFARELNLKLDFAAEGETGEYVLTNTSTWKEWWVVISG